MSSEIRNKAADCTTSIEMSHFRMDYGRTEVQELEIRIERRVNDESLH